MERYQCEQCGKTVEYLKSFGQGSRNYICSCGGKLKPINNFTETQKGGKHHENSYPRKERTSQ
ncbi:hypothetical protein JCM39194_03270 [Desulfotomaculum varum]